MTLREQGRENSGWTLEQKRTYVSRWDFIGMTFAVVVLVAALVVPWYFGLHGRLAYFVRVAILLGPYALLGAAVCLTGVNRRVADFGRDLEYERLRVELHDLAQQVNEPNIDARMIKADKALHRFAKRWKDAPQTRELCDLYRTVAGQFHRRGTRP